MTVTQTLSNLNLSAITHKLKTQGIVLLIGPFVFCIKSSVPSIAKNVQLIYSDFTLLSNDSLIDFHIDIEPASGIRRFYKPQVNFFYNGNCPFFPLPLAQAFPFLEWGMNWCIAQNAHQYLLLHSAVLEKNGKSVILPAQSGSGKSTLCALLAQNGWRLLSDEMALVDHKDLSLQALARPVSLKNESIDVIQTFSEHKGQLPAIMGEVVPDTNKGTISHLKPSKESVAQLSVLSKPFAIIFPLYQTTAPLTVKPIDKADAFMKVIDNSFNYHLLGETGFNTVEHLVEQTLCQSLVYSDTKAVLSFFDELVS